MPGEKSYFEFVIIIIISDSVQNLKGVWVHNTNTKVLYGHDKILETVVNDNYLAVGRGKVVWQCLN